MTEYEYNYENYNDETDRFYRQKTPFTIILLIVVAIVIFTLYKCLG